MKQIFSFILAAMMAIGLAGAASAGNGPPAVPGSLDCGDEDELCVNGYLWEYSYKCEAPWEDDGTYLSIPGEWLNFRAEEDGGYGDCRFNSNLEGDDDVAKYEVKCELENGEKVEFELKNKGLCF